VAAEFSQVFGSVTEEGHHMWVKFGVDSPLNSEGFSPDSLGPVVQNMIKDGAS